MKKITFVVLTILTLGLFLSLVNGPNIKRDNYFDNDIERLMISADEKISEIEDRSLDLNKRFIDSERILSLTE